MLNDFALDFLVRNDHQLWSSSLYLGMVGGAVSALPSRPSGRMTRGAYFLGNCAILLVAALSKALLVPTHGAFEKGHLGAWLVLWGLVQVGCGFALWRLALARSRHALGHCGLAALAFIPLANLWLLVAPPRVGKEPGEAAVHTAFSAGTIASVTVGLALLGGAYWTAQEIEQGTSLGLLQAGVASDLWVRYAINKDGIETVLKGLAAARNPEPRPGEPFTLSRMQAAGVHLYETWVSNEAGSRFSRKQMAELKTYHCSVVDDVPLMNAGAILEHMYVARSGRGLGTIKVSKEICGL